MTNPAPRHRSPNNFLADLFLRALGLCLQTQYISGKIGSRAYSLRQTEVF
ncbi:MAG: hypothetical protein MRQ11_05870 [Candidatus Midichloria mitochondrii]|nr:hypothetical protein [Candidatus Midichloria mitochondrii]MDJ1299510.1 hypothetical protein [Candidatus Midichloria mitochondrii]MDJ1584183.1 hypothetical protein [Candidatus Midichloria mitochondrii]